MTSVTEAAPPAAGSGRQDPLERYDTFVDHVRKVCREPGQRAALRSGLRRPVTQSPRMHAFIAPWTRSNDEAVERAYYAIAAMIAAQARDARDTDLSATVAENAAHGAVGAPETPASAEASPGEEATRRPSLGETLGRADRAGALKNDTAEKRLHLIVRQGVDGVHYQLPGLVQRLRSKGVPVDWGQLLFDLTQWERFRDRVAKRWLQDYYRAVYTRRDHTSDAAVGGTDPGSATTPSTSK